MDPGIGPTRLMARTDGTRTVHAMSHSSDVVATLGLLHAAIRRAETCSREELIVTLDSVAERRPSPTPIEVVARRAVAASAR